MSTALALRDEELSEQEIALIKDSIAKGASDSELKLFVRQCNRTRLDPFAGQIHCIARFDGKLKRDVRTAQVSIDGMRLVAERTERYAGQTEALYCGADGEWTDVWLAKSPPEAAKIGVYRVGFVEVLTATATWDQFAVYNKRRVGRTEPPKYQMELGPMWKKMPAHMLAKCAEALALRKAFPMELSGLYIPEEMGDAVVPEAAPKKARPSRRPAKEEQPTVTRTAPVVINGEAPEEEQLERLRERFELITDDEDKKALNNAWVKAKLPGRAALNAVQIETAIALLDQVLNYVEEVPNDATAEYTDLDEDEDDSPPITAKQIKMINGKMALLGIDDRDAVHDRCQEILGYPVTSVTKLTVRSASKVIDHLIDEVEQEQS